MVAVDTNDETRSKAMDVLNSHGAADVDEERDDLGASDVNSRERAASFNERGEDFVATGNEINERGVDFNARGADLAVAPSPSTAGPRIPADTRMSAKTNEERTIPVIREELEVGKRPVVSGGVRVFSRVVEEPVEEQVRLRQERVVVDRQPADRAVAAGDQGSLREQTIDVMEMSEEPVIQKRSRVVEEVRVGKEATERTETVRDTLRHTEVVTEPIQPGDANGKPYTGNYRADFENDFKRRYANNGGDYSTYAPAYEYGYQMGGDPRFKGKSWDEVEPTIKSDFGRRYPEGAWERMKDAVRVGWDKITGK